MVQRITDKIQVHVPFTMLYESYREVFFEHRLNPEITLDAGALERFSFTDFQDMAKQLHSRSLTVTFHAPFMDLSPGSIDPAISALTRHRFEQMLELVPVFKPKTVVCHTGYDGKRYRAWRGQWIENSLEMWAWLAEQIQNEGGRLMLENVFEHGPDEMQILFENLVDRDVGFCLDTGHQAAFSSTSLETWIESLDPFLGQLHLHDNFGDRDDHLALGRGNIDFQHFFNHLKTLREDPPVITLEPHREEDLWLSIAYLEKLWPW